MHVILLTEKIRLFIPYAPPFKLTNTMLDLVASISEKVGRITTGKNLESKPHLRKNNREICEKIDVAGQI